MWRRASDRVLPTYPSSSYRAPKPGFVVIREGSRYGSVTPPSASGSPLYSQSPSGLSPASYSLNGSPDFGPVSMERTISGLSIESDRSQDSRSPTLFPPSRPFVREVGNQPISDEQALELVRNHMKRIQEEPPECPESQSESILRTIINCKLVDDDWEFDDAALTSILIAANHLFFAGRLQGRVKWDWSHPDSSQYETSIIGTTAFRRRSRQIEWSTENTCDQSYNEGPFTQFTDCCRPPALVYDGIETLIVLSEPILKDRSYSRHLIISTFLHELIHCFLFICCGEKARNEGGHTHAFREIAFMIDKWAGRGVLHLSQIEADLARFRKSKPYHHHQHPHRIHENRSVEMPAGFPVTSLAKQPSIYMPTRRQAEPSRWSRSPDDYHRPRHGVPKDTVWDHVLHDPWAHHSTRVAISGASVTRDGGYK